MVYTLLLKILFNIVPRIYFFINIYKKETRVKFEKIDLMW